MLRRRRSSPYLSHRHPEQLFRSRFFVLTAIVRALDAGQEWATWNERMDMASLPKNHLEREPVTNRPLMHLRPLPDRRFWGASALEFALGRGDHIDPAGDAPMRPGFGVPET